MVLTPLLRLWEIILSSITSSIPSPAPSVHCVPPSTMLPTITGHIEIAKELTKDQVQRMEELNAMGTISS